MKPASSSDNASGKLLSRLLASASLKVHRPDRPADAANVACQGLRKSNVSDPFSPQNASFWAAINLRDGPDALGMLERQRVKGWLKAAYATFDGLPL